MQAEKEYAVYFSRDRVHWHTRGPVALEIVKLLMDKEDSIKTWASSCLGVQSRGFYVRVAEMRARWFRADLNCTVGSAFFARREIRVVPMAELRPQFAFEERDGALYISELSARDQETGFLDTRL